MTDKSLKNKAIKIKGKDYVLVSDRVLFFNENFTNGAILTKYELNDDTYIVQATVMPDADNPARCFYGTSQAVIGEGMVNKTAALENAETSAVGRALAMMGIGVLDSIASADEMTKATFNTPRVGAKYATPKQIEWLRREASKISGLDLGEDIDNWIEEKLTLRPERIPVFKVKDAVDKLLQIGESAQKVASKNYDNSLEEVKKIINKDTVLDLNNLPY